MSEGKQPQLARIRLAKRPAQERRGHGRKQAVARVLAFSRGEGHSETLVEISKGGARIQGEWEPCPTDPVTLTLPGATGPQKLRGRVLRVTPGERRAGTPTTVALKFLP
jgi:hypothetical protein